jgi:haloacetate dehalogenase
VRIRTDEAELEVDVTGDGPAVLLLHGFPETRLMWRSVAPVLARTHTVVTADLRGYGASSCPPSGPDHAAYGKRAMARDAVAVMSSLGFAEFDLVGHDRGGRVAYRTALDHPDRVRRLAVLDVLLVDEVWDRVDAEVMLGFWPWTLLAQPAPLPERLLAAGADAVVAHATGEDWGTPAAAFDDEVRAAYAAVLADPEHAHAICEEYRAAASLDRADDASDRAAGRVIGGPVLALWAAGGPLDTWYADAGGPLALWRALAPDVRGEAVPGGHFFPEAHPADTAARLAAFLSP